MKKVILAMVVCVMAFNVQAQEAKTEATQTESAEQIKQQRMLELMGTKIEMDVDAKLFKPQGPNSYVSENPRAAIMAMMVPDSYENSKQKMENDLGSNMTITEKGEKEVNGATVLYIKGTSEAEGATLSIEMYCMEIDAETCLMFAGMADVNADAKYTEAIKKATNSVIKKK